MASEGLYYIWFTEPCWYGYHLLSFLFFWTCQASSICWQKKYSISITFLSYIILHLSITTLSTSPLSIPKAVDWFSLNFVPMVYHWRPSPCHIFSFLHPHTHIITYRHTHTHTHMHASIPIQPIQTVVRMTTDYGTSPKINSHQHCCNRGFRILIPRQ